MTGTPDREERQGRWKGFRNGKMEQIRDIKLGKHVIGVDSPTFIVAEMSGNHNMDFDRAAASHNQSGERGGGGRSEDSDLHCGYHHSGL